MKKLLTLLMIGVLSVGMFYGCGKTKTTTIDLKVWGSQADQVVLKQLTEEFKKANADKEYNITFGVVGENDAQTTVLEDPSKAADVFSFSDDQLRTLAKAGALYEISGSYKTASAEDFTEASLSAATYNGKQYAFPSTADNGFFLYYDKRVFPTTESVAQLSEILRTCNENNKKFFMDISNGFYIMSFFLGTGCELTLDENENQICDFNSANGLKAAQAIYDLCRNNAFMTGDDTIVTSKFGSDIKAAVSGIWNKTSLEEAVGSENLGAIKLPTFTSGEESYQMYSFAGYKLLGVSKTTKNPSEALRLAKFLTNENSQIEKFEKLGYGPTNKVAKENEEVKQNIIINALSEQSAYSIPNSKSVLGKYWAPAEAFGTALESNELGGKTLQQLLDIMTEDITAE